ncbi:MAG: protein kinase [Polyangia bacterium]
MAAPSFRRGEQIARRYQVVAKSGETSLWVGYHACDQSTQNQSEQKGNIPEPDSLVKVVRPELVAEPGARERLVRDLQRMKGLQHPGLPRLMDVQILEELQTVALIEAIQAGLSQGVLLRRMVTFRQKQRFPLAEVRQIGAQLASVLSYVHGQMLCHGDLRLETVLLRPDGAKLCDIGLGASLPRQSYLEAVRKVNEVDLIAPEVREGKPIDVRADVYGLAALYKHLLSLEQGQEWAAVMAEKPAMQGVLERGLHADPKERYGSIEALIADIEAVARTGQPIKRRVVTSSVAMAVAAGRLPVEELNRAADEVPESARSRRNIFETSAALRSTIPPVSASSTRSARLPQTGEQAGEGSPSASSKDAPASATSRGPASATSRGPASATSRGPASATSRGPRVGGSGRSVPPPGETAPPAADTDAAPATASAAAPAAEPGRPPSERSGRASRAPGRPHGEPAPEASAAAPAARPEARTEARPEARTEARTDGREDAASGAARPAPTPRDKAAEATSRRSPEPATTKPGGERSDTSPRKGSSTSSEERVRSDRTPPLKLPPGMLVTSRLALIGALLLAALVGALVAVVAMLLLRPVFLMGPPPAAVPSGAAATDPTGPSGPSGPSAATPPSDLFAPTPVTPVAPLVVTGGDGAAELAPSDLGAGRDATTAGPAAPPAAPGGGDPSGAGFPTAPVTPVAPPAADEPASPAFPTAPVVPLGTEAAGEPKAPATAPASDPASTAKRPADLGAPKASPAGAPARPAAPKPTVGGVRPGPNVGGVRPGPNRPVLRPAGPVPAPAPTKPPPADF